MHLRLATKAVLAGAMYAGRMKEDCEMNYAGRFREMAFENAKYSKVCTKSVFFWLSAYYTIDVSIGRITKCHRIE